MLALPNREWRTGRPPQEPLRPMESAAMAPAKRIWVDTDAACGHTPRTDPDDCLALLALAEASHVTIAGISVVGGNAPIEVTDRITRELASRLPRPTPIYKGAEAARPLQAALEDGPLTVVALGPLTNVARALADRSDLLPRVERVVAVMGRRASHLFHPAEGASGALLFGHGPVFSDFNFEQDREAAARVLRLELPLVLIPYDAARSIEITASDLDQLAAQGGAAAWVAERSRGWLQFWNQSMGRAGFYPFDLLAAAYVLAPRSFTCARVLAGIAKDPLFLVPWRDRALLVTQRPEDLAGAAHVAPAVYCPRAR